MNEWKSISKSVAKKRYNFIVDNDIDTRLYFFQWAKNGNTDWADEVICALVFDNHIELHLRTVEEATYSLLKEADWNLRTATVGNHIFLNIQQSIGLLSILQNLYESFDGKIETTKYVLKEIKDLSTENIKINNVSFG